MKTLLPHQIEDAKFLAARSFAGCFSGMGSGKTLTALETVRLLNVVEDHYQSTIIIGPPISLYMWATEFEDYFPGAITQTLKTGKVKLNPDADAYIMSYEIATKRRDELKALGAKVLICDESHALKTPSAQRTGAIIGSGGLCESVGHTYLLTGTPSTRYNDDLYTFLARADAPRLKELTGGATLDFERFRLRYCITQPKKYHRHQRTPKIVTVGNRNTSELNELIYAGKLAVRRELADVWAAMPALTISTLQVELHASADLKKRLRSIETQTMSQLQEDLRNNDEALATVRREMGEAKVRASALEIIDRLDAGHRPILVGAWHHSVIDALMDALVSRGADCAALDGRTSPANKLRAVERFNNGDIDVLVGGIGAMGVSLNLQGGSHIIEIEQDFSPAVMDQFRARCHRLGQKAAQVHVDIFSSDTKLDKAIAMISARKRTGHATIHNQGNAA
jgi:SNF2 family DNA or RNA helicase